MTPLPPAMMPLTHTFCLTGSLSEVTSVLAGPQKVHTWNFSRRLPIPQLPNQWHQTFMDMYLCVALDVILLNLSCCTDVVCYVIRRWLSGKSA